MITEYDTARAMNSMLPANCDMAKDNKPKVDEIAQGITRVTGVYIVRYFIEGEKEDFVGAIVDSLLESYPMNSGYATTVSRYALVQGRYYAIVTRLKRLSDITQSREVLVSKTLGSRIDDAFQKGG